MAHIRFTPDTKARKHLAAVIAQTIDTTVVYAGAPSFAYHIGQASLGRDWQLNAAGLSDQQVEAVIEAAAAAGFTTQSPADNTDVGLTLVFPTTGWDEGTEGRLRALLAAKGPLITKSLGIDAVPCWLMWVRAW